MSTVGKVLVVAQVIFSVLLMAFAGGVASVQTNYKQKYNDANGKFNKANADLAASRQDTQKVRDELAAREKTLKNAADKARGEADAGRDKIKQLETQSTQTKTELENMRAEAKVAGDEARARRDEAVAMRDLNAQLHQKRDEVISENRKQADRILNLEHEQRTMVEKHNQLLANYATVQRFVRSKGFDPDPKELAGLSEPPPIVQGLVLEAQKGTRNGSELVAISLGSDAGLAKGHKLYVYRSNNGKGKYLGTIRLDHVDYRTSVGVLIQSTKNGEIQRGDNVTSKL